MNDSVEKVVLILLPVLVGGLVAIAPTLLVERVRHRTTIQTRWDTVLQVACGEFAATAHRLLRLSARIAAEDTSDELRTTLIGEIYDEHARLRTLMEQIWLVSGSDLQKASRMVVKHAAAVREFAISGTDPNSEQFSSSPAERFSDGIARFFRSARAELRVREPDDLAPRDPPRGGY
ncbi:hypothetical protein AB0H49_14645 [Nocardia sp. NPDC050713]|uniref:hypothetical protein n=1 Tax=Nocardia sp. NPDC050713 TaxID=3154511 RepID=UPI0033DDF0FF